MAARLPMRLISRQLQSHIFRRTFSSSPSALEAQNFTMPAMSPTMTEGNIASWKVKEGDSFSTGDILLEIETDKATMDVEAQDDGIMAKIFVQDGSKGVKVGTRIAVLAEEGDDLSTLEIPEDDSKPVSEAKDGVQKEEEDTKPPEPAPAKQAASKPASTPSGPGQNKKYPLYPSVIALVHEHHISDEDIAKIPATGPNNRLLKGDVLAYLGTIEADYSAKQSKRIEHMGHLDLSNIKVRPPPEKSSVSKPEAVSKLPELPAISVVSVPISLSEVLKVQKRIQDTIGVSLPLSTFLARAVDIANDDLPRVKGSKPSADELFNAVLGLDAVPTTARGAYLPQIDSVAVSASVSKSRMAKQPDIIDILTGRAGTVTRPTVAAPSPLIGATGGALNVFSLTVPVGEEKRARTFLEKMKTVLQVEPGRLVI